MDEQTTLILQMICHLIHQIGMMPLQLRHVMPTHQLFIQMRLVLSLHPLDPSLYRNVKKVDEGSHEEESADGQTSQEEIILSNVLSCIGLFGVVEIIGG